MNDGLRALEDAVPESTKTERQRFLSKRKGNVELAAAQLSRYIEWRREHHQKDSPKGNDSWAYACKVAVEKFGAQGNRENQTRSSNGTGGSGSGGAELPCVLFVDQHQDSSQPATPVKNEAEAPTSTPTPSNSNRRYLHYLPARMDTNLAQCSTYALAIALFVDQTLDRSSSEKLTILIDTRPGEGWANVPAYKLLPFIQSACKSMCDLHPNRMERCVIFPVPRMASALWNAVKPFLDEETAKKVCLVSGSAKMGASVPEKLADILEPDVVKRIDERRETCCPA